MAEGILGSMSVRLGAEISEFQKKMRQVNKDFAGVIQASEGMRDVGQSLTAYVSAPLAALAGVSLKAAADMGKLKAGLVAMSSSSEEAGKEFKRLEQLAKMPGLGLEQAVKGSINLQAVGFSANQARKTLEAFGNAIATTGGSADDLEEVTRQLGQIQSAGKLTAENLNVIKERSPLTAKALLQAFGTTNAEAIQKMGVTTDEFITKLTDQLNKLPKVSGGLANSFENAGNSIRNFLAGIGESIDKNFNIGAVLDGFSNALDNLRTKFDGLSPVAQKLILTLGTVAIAIGPILVALGTLGAAIPAIVAGWGVLVKGFSAASSVLSLATLKIVAITAAAAGLILIAKGIYDSWGTIAIFFSQVWDKIKLIFYNGALGAVEAVEGLTEKVGITFEGVKKTLQKNATETQKSLDSKPYVSFGDMMGEIGDNIAGTVQGITGAITGFFNSSATEADKAATSFAASAAKMSGKGGKGLPKVSSSIAVGDLDMQTEGLKESQDSESVINGIKQQNAALAEQHRVLGMLQPAYISLGGAIQSVGGVMAEFAEQVERTIESSVETLAGGFGEMLGTIAATGQGFSDFPKFILSTIGDLAIQVGKMAIGVGIAISGIKKALQSLNPVLAIAGGIALVALGSAVKGSLSKAAGGSGGGGSSYSPPSASSGSSSSASVSPSEAANQEVTFRITGTDLEGVLRKQGYKNSR